MRRQLEKVQRARKEVKDRFPSIWGFDYLVLLPSDSTSRTKVAFVRAGSIVAFEDFETASLIDSLPAESLATLFRTAEARSTQLAIRRVLPRRELSRAPAEVRGVGEAGKWHATLQATSRSGVTGRAEPRAAESGYTLNQPLLVRRRGRDIKKIMAKPPLMERTGWWFNRLEMTLS